MASSRKPGGRGGTTSASARACRSSSAGAALGALTAGASTFGIHCLTKAPIASPITEAVYRILYEAKSPRETVTELMLRAPKGEK